MSSASLAGCSMLICEGRAPDRLRYCEAFSNAGARVVAVPSLANALITIEDQVPSALILDHALSDGKSSQHRALKERNIPYLVHSAYATREQGDVAGNDVNLPKPASLYR